MIGKIKDIVQPRDVNLYNHINMKVEKRRKSGIFYSKP